MVRIAAALLVVGCGSSEAPPGGASASSGGPIGCGAGELPLEDGGCRLAGVPAAMCASGFEPATDGCQAVLPSEPCAKGQLAIPGDTACRDVAPCGDGTWGSIPIEPTTQHVDLSYPGADSDGSQTKPWKTIQEGVDAAEPAAIVAVAAGSYAEDVVIDGQPVRLWGVCPGLVEVAGAGVGIAAVVVTKASGAEVRDIAMRGQGPGLAVSGTEELLLDRIWIHDTGARAVAAEDTLGTTSIQLTRSLLEGNRESGVSLVGSTATIEASVIRDSQPTAGKQAGRGVSVQKNLMTGTRGAVLIRGSVLQGNHEVGLFAGASDVTIEGSLVRGTQPKASDQSAGTGIELAAHSSGDRTNASVVSSVIEGNRSAGILVDSSDAVLEGTVVRDTQPQASDQHLGDGIAVRNTVTMGAQRSTLTLRASLVERNAAIGVVVSGADATVEASIVRDTQPDAADARGGYGLIVGSGPAETAVLNVRASVFQRNRGAGIALFDSSATIESSLIADTEGFAADGSLGDGLAIVRVSQGASASVFGCEIRTSARAGVSAFGATVDVGGTHLECNEFHLVGETNPDASFALEDLGGNSCGCGGAKVACQVESPGLAAPEPVALP